MFCISCGAEINDGVTFCPSCGAQQSEGELQHSMQKRQLSIPEYSKELQDKVGQFKAISTDELLNIAENKEPTAWAELGDRYQKGVDVEQSNEEAFKWFKKSAEAGEASGINHLGLAYEYGWGVDKDEEKAADLYLQAAKLGWNAAIANYGLMLENGTGVEKNLEHAAKWYRLGAERGNARSQCYLAMSIQHGNGVEQDDTKAIYWFQKAAKQNYSNALVNLGWMFEMGRGIKKDTVKACDLYLKSANLDSSVGMCNVGLCYENGRGVKKDLAKANEWYFKSAELGNAKAMFNLGSNYERGTGFTKSWRDANAWYQKAAEKGHKESEFRAQFRLLECDKSQYRSKSGFVKFYRTSGTVLESKRSSETHVSSSGGGGYVGRYGGHVEAAQVHSQVITTDDFWIETENGSEKQITINNKNIALRNGQKISLFHAIPEHKDTGAYLLLVNHSDGGVNEINTGQSWWQKEQLKGIGFGLVKVIVFIIGSFYLFEGRDALLRSEYWFEASLLGTLGYFIYKCIMFSVKAKRGCKLIQKHSDAMREWALTGNTNYTPRSIGKTTLPKKGKYAVGAVLVVAALATMVNYLPKQTSRVTALLSSQFNQFYTTSSSATVKQNMPVDISPYEGKWHGTFKVAKKPNQPAVDIDLEIAKGKIKLSFHASSKEQTLTLHAVNTVNTKGIALSEFDEDGKQPESLGRDMWVISMNSTNELLLEWYGHDGDVEFSENLQRQLR